MTKNGRKKARCASLKKSSESSQATSRNCLNFSFLPDFLAKRCGCISQRIYAKPSHTWKMMKRSRFATTGQHLQDAARGAGAFALRSEDFRVSGAATTRAWL